VKVISKPSKPGECDSDFLRLSRRGARVRLSDLEHVSLLDTSRAVAAPSGPPPAVLGGGRLFVKGRLGSLARSAHPAHVLEKGQRRLRAQHILHTSQRGQKGSACGSNTQSCAPSAAPAGYFRFQPTTAGRHSPRFSGIKLNRRSARGIVRAFRGLIRFYVAAPPLRHSLCSNEIIHVSETWTQLA